MNKEEFLLLLESQNIKVEGKFKNSLIKRSLISDKILLDGLDSLSAEKYLSKEELQVLYDYTNSSTKINICCRNGLGNKIIKNKIEIIGDILDRFTLNKDIILFRGISLGELEKYCNIGKNEIRKNGKDLAFWNNFLGIEFEYKTFVSTSLIKRPAKAFSEIGLSVIFVINAKSNWKGLNLTAISEYPKQKEILLQKNSKFIIKNVDLSHRTNEVFLEGNYDR